MDSVTLRLLELRIGPGDQDFADIKAIRLKELALWYGIDPAPVVTAFEAAVAESPRFLRSLVRWNLYGYSRCPLPMTMPERISRSAHIIAAWMPFRSGVPYEPEVRRETVRQYLLNTENWFSLTHEPWGGHIGIPEDLFRIWRKAVCEELIDRVTVRHLRPKTVSWSEYVQACRLEDEALLSESADAFTATPCELVGNNLPDGMKAAFAVDTGTVLKKDGLVVRPRPPSRYRPEYRSSVPCAALSGIRLQVVEKRGRDLINSCFLNDPSVLGDPDFVSDRDRVRMRSHLRTVEAVRVMLSQTANAALNERAQGLFRDAELIRRACASVH